MDESGTSNGRHHRDDSVYKAANPYADAVTGAQPREIVDFEMGTDPYRNSLPGISNIRAASVIGNGLGVGRRGHPVIMVVSVFLLLVLLAPALLAILDHFVH